MAVFGKNTRVDTPFDDYKERSAETDGFHVGRASAASFYMSIKSVVFLVGIILSICMKCENIGSCLVWSSVVFVMVILWSFTVRFFVPHKNLMANIIINLLYVTLFGIAYSYSTRYIGKFLTSDYIGMNLELVYDLHYLTPMAIAFSSVSHYEYERPDYSWTVLFPTGVGIAVMFFSSLILDILDVTKGFAAILLAAIILMVLSFILSAINKHGVYFAPPPQYDIFSVVPIKEQFEFRRFVLNKIALLLASAVSVSISLTGVHFLGVYGQYLRYMMPAVMALLLGGLVAVIGKIPFLQEPNVDEFDIRYYLRYYEYPAISAFLSLPFAVEHMGLIKLVIYLFLLVLADSVITGLLVSLPRRTIFVNKNPSTTGAPSILLIISLFVMVGTIFFVIY